MDRREGEKKLAEAGNIRGMYSSAQAQAMARSLLEDVARSCRDEGVQKIARKSLAENIHNRINPTPTKNQGRSSGRLAELIRTAVTTPQASNYLKAESPIGMDGIQQQICGYIARYVKGLAPRGISMLLQGPPGVGKTTLGRYVAFRSGGPFVHLRPGLFRDVGFGMTEQIAQEFFDWLRSYNVNTKEPVVVFLDEAEQFLSGISNPSNSADIAEVSLKSIFREWWDGLDQDTGGIILIAATNRSDMFEEANLDRFDHVIKLDQLDLKGRMEIIRAKIRAVEKLGFGPLLTRNNVLRLGIKSYGLSGRGIARSVNQAMSLHEQEIIGSPLWGEAENSGLSWMKVAQKSRWSNETMDQNLLDGAIVSQRERADLPSIRIMELPRRKIRDIQELARYLSQDVVNGIITDTGSRLALVGSEETVAGISISDSRNSRVGNWQLMDVETCGGYRVVYLDGHTERPEPRFFKDNIPPETGLRNIRSGFEYIVNGKTRDVPSGLSIVDESRFPEKPDSAVSD